jgi:hypothetical protein
LRLLDREAGMRFPDPISPGLMRLGLILDGQLDASRYDRATPRNCRTFAHTGGEGVHFSLLVRDGRICEESPVVITIPLLESLVVGETLFDFLCLGRHRGYFALEQLAYDRALTLKVFTDPHWQANERRHRSVGYAVDETDYRLLDWLAGELELSPWTDPERFQQLQDRFLPLLQLPPDGNG